MHGRGSSRASSAVHVLAEEDGPRVIRGSEEGAGASATKDEGTFGPEVGKIECPACKAILEGQEAFDEHYWTGGACGPQAARKALPVDVSDGMGDDSGVAKSEPVTRANDPKNVNAEPVGRRDRHGARGALTLKAQKRCRRGHLKPGPGRCTRCQADWQVEYRKR